MAHARMTTLCLILSSPAAAALTVPTASRTTAVDLPVWLEQHAAITPKFLPAVLATCDEQMIGSVSNLDTLADAGLLSSIFKPVIAASIERALGDGGDVSVAAAAAVVSDMLAEQDASEIVSEAGSLPPLKEVKRMLAFYDQSTWGDETVLRKRYSMFAAMEQQKQAQWDPKATAWVNPFKDLTAGGIIPAARLRTTPPRPKPSVPPFVAGAQESKCNHVAAAPVAAAPVAEPPAVEPPAAEPPEVEATVVIAEPAIEEAPAVEEALVIAEVPAVEETPTAAPPAADPNKASFTVLLKNPDGEQTLEYDKDSEEFLLDYIDELEEAEDFEHLPYACRAGACSACAGKLVSGSMDTSACGFLTPEQKADGWVLTCTAKPTSDVVLETHKEDDMY